MHAESWKWELNILPYHALHYIIASSWGTEDILYTHKHMHTYTHINMHMHIHKHMHKYMHTYTLINRDILYTHKHMHTYTHKHMHTYIIINTQYIIVIYQ